MSFEKGGTCVLAWKRKDGLGVRFSKQKWEQRWFFLADGHIIYYQMGEEDRFGEADYEPRGKIDLARTKTRVEVTSNPSADAPTPNEVEIISEEIVQPTASAHMEKPKKPTVTRWRLCFDNQQALIEFLEKAHAILENCGQLEEKDASRFEHEFHPGDHIYRWEMIVCPPVIYPIQIHGIVLEAGRNCVVVADFGLTGYGKKSTKDDFHHADKAHDSKILTAFKKLRPNSDQRLHITTLTDPMDIRKWTKAHYDEKSYQKPDKLKKLTKLLGKLKKNKQQIQQQLKEEEVGDDNKQTKEEGEEGTAKPSDGNISEGSDHSDSSHHNDKSNSLRQRAHSEEYAQKRQEEHPLPKADPKDIVLSRANFLLEQGEEKLPPYHVFYSNSECIAVWCKTGRWSTLQTAVFLSSNAIGGAKSATVATIGVAAAHAILAPVVAVGGLLWVSAPMVILQKSRQHWEKNTQLMTNLYWEWAPSKVYVCAIEHWSEVGYTSQQQRQLLKEKAEQEAAAANENEDKSETVEIKKYSSEEILNTNAKNNNNAAVASNGDDKEESTNSPSSVLEADKECKLEN